MVVTVLSKIGHELSRKVIGSTLAGDGLLVRLRSTSIGLLGMVAAVCLALVAFVAAQSWPEILNSPLPATPPKIGAVHDAVALRPANSLPRARAAGAVAGIRGNASAPRSGRHAGGAPSGSSGGTGRVHAAHQVAGPAPGSQPAPAPQSAPAPAPTPTAPSSPAGGDAESAPTPTPAPTRPVTAVAAPGESKSPPTDVGSTPAVHGKSESASRSDIPAKPKSHGVSKPAPPHHAPAPPVAETVPQETAPPGDNGSASEQQHGNGRPHGKSGKSEH